MVSRIISSWILRVSPGCHESMSFGKFTMMPHSWLFVAWNAGWESRRWRVQNSPSLSAALAKQSSHERVLYRSFPKIAALADKDLLDSRRVVDEQNRPVRKRSGTKSPNSRAQLPSCERSRPSSDKCPKEMSLSGLEPGLVIGVSFDHKPANKARELMRLKERILSPPTKWSQAFERIFTERQIVSEGSVDRMSQRIRAACSDGLAPRFG